MESKFKKIRKILSTDQASEYMGNFITPKTLVKWRAIPGKGPKFVKLGSRVGYLIDDLDKWIDANIKTSEDDFSVAV